MEVAVVVNYRLGDYFAFGFKEQSQAVPQPSELFFTRMRRRAMKPITTSPTIIGANTACQSWVKASALGVVMVFSLRELQG